MPHGRPLAGLIVALVTDPPPGGESRWDRPGFVAALLGMVCLTLFLQLPLLGGTLLVLF